MEWDTPLSSPLSAFTAVPNPQMLAFMGTQSFIMMYQAGEGWQYGKRKQSAMSNEEFNKQTPLSIMDRQRTELINALPSIKDSMNAMTPLISTIVEQYGDFAAKAIEAIPPALKNATEGLSIPGFAYGSGAPAPQQENLELTTALVQIAKWLLGGNLIKNVGNSKTPNPETEEERKANDIIIQEQTNEIINKTNEEIREENKFGNVVPKNPQSATSVKETDSYIKALYQNEIFTLSQSVVLARTNLREYQASSSQKGNILTQKIKKLSTAQKALQNRIVQGRNNIKTRALASSDWNNRIWL